MKKILLFLIIYMFPFSAFSEGSLYIHKPPANVRDAPQGNVYCEITGIINIKTSNPELDYKKKKWYPIEVCGKKGFIHESEVIFYSKYSDINFNDLKYLSEKGDDVAQYLIAERYEDGEGVKKDNKKAFEWYKKSAEQGVSIAQFKIGNMYFMGEVVEEDNEEAMKWYKKAAKQGNANAKFNLGLMYANGYGVEVDREEAVRWYKKSAEQGNTRAQEEIEKYAGLDEAFEHGVDRSYNGLVIVKKFPANVKDSEGEIICSLKDIKLFNYGENNVLSSFDEVNVSGVYLSKICGETYQAYIDESYLAKFDNDAKKNKYLAKEIFSNKDNEGSALLKLFDENIKDDREIVMMAVKSSGDNLKYANDKFRNDREIASAAINDMLQALVYTDKKLKDDEEFIEEVLGDYKDKYMYLVKSVDGDYLDYKKNFPDDAPDIGVIFIEIQSFEDGELANLALPLIKMKIKEAFSEDNDQEYVKIGIEKANNVFLIKVENRYKIIMKSQSSESARIFFDLFNRMGFDDAVFVSYR